MTFSNSTYKALQCRFHRLHPRDASVERFVNTFQNHKTSDAVPESLSLTCGVRFSLWKLAPSSFSFRPLWNFMICFAVLSFFNVLGTHCTFQLESPSSVLGKLTASFTWQSAPYYFFSLPSSLSLSLDLPE